MSFFTAGRVFASPPRPCLRRLTTTGPVTTAECPNSSVPCTQYRQAGPSRCAGVDGLSSATADVAQGHREAPSIATHVRRGPGAGAEPALRRPDYPSASLAGAYRVLQVQTFCGTSTSRPRAPRSLALTTRPPAVPLAFLRIERMFVWGTLYSMELGRVTIAFPFEPERDCSSGSAPTLECRGAPPVTVARVDGSYVFEGERLSSWCGPVPGKHWMPSGRRGAIWPRSRADRRGPPIDPEPLGIGVTTQVDLC